MAVAFVDFVIASWADMVAGLRDVDSTIKRTSDGRKAGIEVRHGTHIALIEVWENGSCLDTYLMREGEKEVALLSSGPCGDRPEAIERMHHLTDALLK